MIQDQLTERRGSDWYGAVVVRLTNLSPHPDPETTSLEVTQVFGVEGDENSGIPVVVRKGEYRVGQLAVYTGIDSLVPTERARFAFLAKDSKVDKITGERIYRVKAKKLRGVYSEGLLTPARAFHRMFDVPGHGEETDLGTDPFPEHDNGFLKFSEGQDLTLQLGVRKYLPECEMDLVRGELAVDSALHADLSCGLALYRGPGSTLLDWLTAMLVRPGSNGWSWMSRAHVLRAIKSGYVQVWGCDAPCATTFFNPDYELKEGDSIRYVVYPAASLKLSRPGGSVANSDAVVCPLADEIPCYDLEPLRRHGDVFQDGEFVVVYEKIHGANGRAYHDGTRLWVGSRTQWKARPENPENDLWWKAAARYKLEEKLAKVPGLVFYFEVFGQVQDLKYGAKPGEVFIAVFDILITKPFGEVFSVYRTAEGIGVDRWIPKDGGEVGQHPQDRLSITSSEVVASGVTFTPDQQGWLDDLQTGVLCDVLELPQPPMLYRGPYDPEVVMPLRNGPSMWSMANNIREGFVIRPFWERRDRFGRVVMKVVGEDYKLR